MEGSSIIAWLYTLRVEDKYVPGGSGGRRTMQTVSFCSDDESLIHEVEGRWATTVVEVLKKTGLKVVDDD